MKSIRKNISADKLTQSAQLLPEAMLEKMKTEQAKPFQQWLKNQHASDAKAANKQGHYILLESDNAAYNRQAAEMLARDAGGKLFRVDLSTVLSKYIGETEKNLDKVFDEARPQNLVIFFDEADALFGKRTEVKDAHDKYANQEVVYLLQKIEEYKGVVVVATKRKTNIDSAFTRRFQTVIRFDH